MSLTADLALVTACRDRLTDFEGITYHVTVTVTSAALSLIEDTLGYHKRCGPWCPENHGALTALHTIATALGVETRDA